MSESLQRILPYNLAFSEGIDRCRSATTFKAADWQDAYNRLSRVRDRYTLECKLNSRFRGHTISCLCNDLPQDMRTAVETQYEKTKPSIGTGKTVEFVLEIECGSVSPEVIKQENDKEPNPPRDHSLKSILERSSDAFVTWRYLHEGGRKVN